MAEFRFTIWFHGLCKRTLVAIRKAADEGKTVKILVRPSFYMNIMYNASAESPVDYNSFMHNTGNVTLYGCEIDPCLTEEEPYYKIMIGDELFYKKDKL